MLLYKVMTKICSLWRRIREWVSGKASELPAYTKGVTAIEPNEKSKVEPELKPLQILNRLVGRLDEW
jgi:hypothetical protein